MDLLTVLAHELGHLLGREDLDPVTQAHDLMAATLGVGMRRLPAGESDLAARTPFDRADLNGRNQPASRVEDNGPATPSSSEALRRTVDFLARLDALPTAVLGHGLEFPSEDDSDKTERWWMRYW
jgi:hypothetical protein